MEFQQSPIFANTGGSEEGNLSTEAAKEIDYFFTNKIAVGKP
jgi:hypothetical protein